MFAFSEALVVASDPLSWLRHQEKRMGKAVSPEAQGQMVTRNLGSTPPPACISVSCPCLQSAFFSSSPWAGEWKVIPQQLPCLHLPY